MEKNSYFFEIWRPVYGYECWYEVSNFGRVRSFDRVVCINGGSCIIKGRILKQYKDNMGYLFVRLYSDKQSKQFKVHRLVAIAFIPNPLNLPQVNHRNEIKTDNRAENLEWCDAKYNTNYGTAIERRVKKQKNRSDLSKPVICLELNKVFPSVSEAARWLGNEKHIVSDISRCCLGKPKKDSRGYYFVPRTCCGYHWEFYDDKQKKMKK